MYKCHVCGQMYYKEDMAVIDDNGWNCCANCEKTPVWIDTVPQFTAAPGLIRRLRVYEEDEWDE